MSDDEGVVAEDRAQLERARASSFESARNRREPRDPDLSDKLAKRVVREGGKSAKDGVKASAKLLKNSGGIAAKYGVRQMDTFLLAFTTVTTLSYVGVGLAILAIIVLDIRWVVGKFSKRIPSMLLPQTLYLAALNALLALIVSFFITSFVVVYCASQASYFQLGKSMVVGGVGWLAACFDA